jgi:hypothetical protein
MTKRGRIIFAVIGLIIFSFCVEGWGAERRLYISKDWGTYNYDEESVSSSSNNINRAWTKTILTDKGRNEAYNITGRKEAKDLDRFVALVEITMFIKLTIF